MKNEDIYSMYQEDKGTINSDFEAYCVGAESMKTRMADKVRLWLNKKAEETTPDVKPTILAMLLDFDQFMRESE